MMKTHASAFGSGCAPVSHIVKTPLFRTAVSVLLAFAALSARAADYNWTGGAGNCLFSDTGNWTNELGEAVAPANNTSTTFSFSFPVDVSGVLITNDVNGSIFAKSLVIERTDSGAAEIKFVSLPHVAGDASTGWADKEKYIFDFAGNSTFDVPADTTLILNTDMGRWVNNDVTKTGEGTVIFDFIRSPGTERTLVMTAGTAEVAATSADTKFHVKMSGGDPSNLPVFINHKDGQVLGSLDSQRSGGTVQLNGTTVTVGAQAMITGGANILPPIVGGKTITFQNERVAKVQELAPTYGITLDRADFTVPHFGGTAIHWTFEDASNPTRDDNGAGSRMVVSGSPVVVEDPTRGNVLSFTGGAYMKGPDTSTWLNEFDPTAGYTLAFWMKPDANCDVKGKIFFLGVNENGKALAIRLDNTSTTKNLMVTCWGGNQTPTTGNLRDGNWHHIAVTYSGEPNGSGNMRLYIDGSNVHTWSAANCNPQKKDLYIGNIAGSAWGWAGSAIPYTGLMDDVVLASRCFSAQEVLSLCNTGIVVGDDETPALRDVAAKSSGALRVESTALSVKTLSGNALAGGIELAKHGTELTVGTDAGAASTVFKGKIMGADSTLVKEGADYTLELGGTADAITNIVVSEGSLILRRPTRRGLVAHYAFEEDNPGIDSSVSAVHLIDTNSTPTTITRISGGVSGSAAHFPGGTHLRSAGSLPSSIPSGNASFTISVWIKPTQEAAAGTVPVCCWGANGSRRISMIRFTGTSGMQFGNWDEDMSVSGLTTLLDGNWHHVVAVYDAANTTKRFYFDGVLKGEKTTVSVLNIATSNPLQIGHSSVDSRIYQYYSGDMDEFMVFDYPWSAEEVSNEFNRIPATTIPVVDGIPAPVARWTFDDATNPGADTTGNAALTLTAEGDIPLESGNAICGLAARFTSTNGYFKLPEFPSDIIPSDKATFTVVVRYRPDTTQHNSTAPAIVRWGLSSADGSFTFGAGASQADSLRPVLSSSLHIPSGFYRTPIGNDRLRWLTAAVVVRGVSSLPNARYAVFYADGEQVSEPAFWCTKAIAAQDFSIGANYTGGARYYGLIDDVQIYNRELSAGQVRLIAEQFDASKGQATTGRAIPAGVLTAQPNVTVAQGATLKVSSVENIGSLSGSGAVEVAQFGRLNLSAVSSFDGTVSGTGEVGIADNAVVDFGDGTRPLITLDAPLAFGANVTVNTTAVQGRYLFAEAESFAGTENLSSWMVQFVSEDGEPVNNKRPYGFFVSSDGKRLYLSMQSCTMLLFR